MPFLSNMHLVSCNEDCMTFEAIMVVTMKSAIFWGVIPCSHNLEDSNLHNEAVWY